MRVVNEGEALVRKNVKLVSSMVLASPESVVGNEETHHPFGQAGASGVAEVGR